MPNFNVSLKQEIFNSILNNKALLLDFDGTLMDYQKNERKALEKLCFKIDLPLDLHEKAINDYITFNNQYWNLFEQKKIDIEEARHKGFEDLIKAYSLEGNSKDMNALFLECLIETTVIDDEIKKNLRLLKKLDTKLIIITNGSHKAQTERLKNAGLIDIIDTYFTSESVGHAKPHPKMFEDSKRYLKTVNCSTDNIWVVGDNLEADIKGGFNVGFNTCWITNHQQVQRNGYPTMQVSNFLEFAKYYLQIKENGF